MNSVTVFGNTYITLTLSAVSLALLLVYLPPQGRSLLKITSVYWPAALVAIAGSGLLFATAPFLWPPLLTLANMSNVAGSLLLALITASWNRKIPRQAFVLVGFTFVAAAATFEVLRQGGAATFDLRVYAVTLARACLTIWMIIELWHFNRRQKSYQVRLIIAFSIGYALANLSRAAVMFATSDGVTPHVYAEGLAMFATRIAITATQLFVAISFTNYFIECLWSNERDANRRLASTMETDRQAALSRQSLLSDRLGASERALQEMRSQFAIALDAAQMGMWVRDARSGDVWVSESWRAIFGIGHDEPPRSATVSELVHPDDRHIFQHFSEALEDGQRQTAEYRIVRRDGQIRWIASWAQLEFDDSGSLLFSRAISTDVTDRKDAEQELQQRRLEVTHLSRVNMLGALSGGIAHELNQPLTAILSNAQAGQRFLSHPRIDIQELHAIFDDIANESARAGEVIRRLRRLFRAGQVQGQPTDLNSLIRDTVRMLDSDMISQRVACTLELSPSLVPVWADPVQLQQVLINLLMNAVEALAARPPDERRVTVVSERRAHEGLCVTVTDTGPGMNDQDTARVFDAFYSTKESGMGLGLSVCRTIVQAHGGRIWAAPGRDGGAEFGFCIPTAP